MRKRAHEVSITDKIKSFQKSCDTHLKAFLLFCHQNSRIGRSHRIPRYIHTVYFDTLQLTMQG